MTHFIPRADAVDHMGRDYVPTVYGQESGNTVWIDTVQGWRDAGGRMHFNEDQTEVTFSLPEGHKFGIGFDPLKNPKTIAALEQAERFISGFEDDETQEGIADLLMTIRLALPYTD